jgi:Fe-S cluster assembly protein SufD
MQRKVIDWQNLPETLTVDEDLELVGVFVGRNSDEIKEKLRIVHTKPGLTSRVTLKAVLYDQSKFNVEAILAIDKGASGTDTYLKMDVMLLSDQATARAVPSLEIHEDAVKGGHGATVGMVDAEQMHYLVARGLSRAQAEALLVEAFLGEFVALLN